MAIDHKPYCLRGNELNIQEIENDTQTPHIRLFGVSFLLEYLGSYIMRPTRQKTYQYNMLYHIEGKFVLSEESFY